MTRPDRPRQLYTTMSGHLYHTGQICIIMVGLPGRGKTNLSERISRFLNWLGVRTQVFHLSNYRRELLGADFELSPEYFAAKGPDSARAIVERKCLAEITSYFVDQGGQVVVYDAVNATSAERLALHEHFKKIGVESLYVESLVTDERVLARNIAEVRTTSPDYAGKDPKISIEHYLRHIEARMSYYEPVREAQLVSIKLVNNSEHCIVQNGPLTYLLNRVLMFLLNSRRRTGSIFFARAGSTDTEEYLNNGDNDLNPRGRMYATTLANTLMGYISSKQLDWHDVKFDSAQLRRVADHKSQLFASALPSALPSAAPSRSGSRSPSRRNSVMGSPPQTPSIGLSQGHHQTPHQNTNYTSSRKGSVAATPTESPLVVWTAARRTAVQTARPFRDAGVPVSSKSLLNQLNAGDAAPYYNHPEKLKEHFPSEYEEFLEDTYHYRFPRAESYQDVAVRMEPLIMGMEREQTNLLIIGHETVLRVLYGYIMGLSSDRIPHLHFPADKIVELVPHGYYNMVVHIPLAGVSQDGGVNLPE